MWQIMSIILNTINISKENIKHKKIPLKIIFLNIKKGSKLTDYNIGQSVFLFF